MLAYSIDTARASGLFDKVIVSTDSVEIATVAKAYGAKIHNRAKKLAEDQVGTQLVMKAALQWWLSSPGTRAPEFACCIYATAPLMMAVDIRNGFAMLQSNDHKYVFAAGPDAEDAGQWYWGRPKSFLQEVPLDGNSARLCLPAERVCDINTEDDWQRAERMYADIHHPMGHSR